MEEVAIIADSKGKGFEFAKGVYEYLKNKGEGFSVRLIDIERTKFKDGEVKIRIGSNIRNAKCFLIHDSNKDPYEWFTELVFKLEAMNFSSPEEINVILPYTKFARQDRKDESRVSVNAKALADVISLYATRGMTVDLHNPQMQEYFSIPFDNLYSFISLVNYLKKNHPDIFQDLVVVSPDLGGGKRAEYLVKKLLNIGVKADVAFGYKTREKENEVARTVIIGEVKDKNCLIIDDIIDTGNTMIKTAEKLREIGAKKIFAYGTHGLFTGGTERFKIFDRVLVSDTLKAPETGNLEIVSLVKLFGEAIYRTVIGKSLSVLFGDNEDISKDCEI
ncbi:MAG: ribose-phosphate diphosphokinase [Candidatus Nanoarchaeia archaeon]|nr:ribose-phosphate diphosphokinase [Candidatus Nanoarchaeia archaeon]MDD5741388.1 ribose-phosphate diphosphokinase [Candidatus Nanoarchaeia archaeon]